MNDNEELVFGEEVEQEYLPIAEGEYELKIDEIKRATATTTGRDQLKFVFKIRSDVAQPEKDRTVWYTINKKDGDKSFNWYRINQLILTQKGTKEYRTNFKNGLDEVLLYLQGKHLVGYVNIVDGDTKQFNSIDGDSFAPSKWDVSHPATEPKKEITATNTEKLDEAVSDSELPW